MTIKRGPFIQRYVYKEGTDQEKVVLRSTTKNIVDPSPAQIVQRLRLAEASHKAKGATMDGDLPPAAEVVQEECTGPTGLAKEPEPKVWEEELWHYAEVEFTPEEEENFKKYMKSLAQ